MTDPDPREVLRQSSVLATRQQVQAAIGGMADEINSYYGDREITLLIVMTGAVMPVTWLAEPRYKPHA